MERETWVPFEVELLKKSASWQEKDAKTLLELVEVLKTLEGDYDFADRHDFLSLPEDDGLRMSIKPIIDGSERDLMDVYHELGDLVPNIDFSAEGLPNSLDEVRSVVRAIEKKFPEKQVPE